MTTQPCPPWRAWIGPAMVLLGVTSIATLLAFQHPLELTTDQVNLGLIVLQRLKPQNLANDYAFGDPAIFGYYTPSFTRTTLILTQLTGSFDRALAWLVLPVAGIYLAGMTGLVYRITGRRWLSVGIALASAVHHPLPMGDMWVNVLRPNGMAPRAIYQAVLPYLFGALLILLDTKRQPRPAWAWGLFGLALGLSANLHPVSVMSMGVAAGGMIVLALLRGDVRLHDVWLAVPGLMLGTAPMLVTFVRGTEGVPVENYSFTFATFYEIAQKRITRGMWPWKIWKVAGLATLLGMGEEIMPASAQAGVLIAHSIISGLSGLGLWCAQKRPGAGWRRHVCWIVLASAQVVLPACLVIRIPWLSLFLIAYLAYRLGREGRLDALDKRLLEAFVLFVSMATIALVGQYIWRSFEVWWLSTWVTQLSRGTRLVYLPAYIVSARLLSLWLGRRDWMMLAAGVALIVRPDMDIAALVLSLLMLGLWLAWPDPKTRLSGSRAALAGLAGALVIEQTLGALALNQSHLPALVTLPLTFGLTWLVGHWPQTRRSGVYVAGLMGLALVLLPPQRYTAGDSQPAPLGTLLPARLKNYVLDKWHSAFPLGRTASLSPSQRDELELYEWARTQTPVDSVFYTDSIYFRLRAERSITHSWKDLGTAFVIRYPLVDFYQRYQYLNEAYNDPADLSAAARSVGADYVVVPTAREVSLDWPTAFQNDHYVVYHLGTGFSP